MFTRNEGVLDRDIRLALGLLLMIPSVFMFSGILQIVGLVLTVVLMVTAATGTCLFYSVLGINTNKSENQRGH
jgi:hypothetical protein